MYYFLYLILFAGLSQNPLISAPPAAPAELAAEPTAVDPNSPEAFTAQAREDAALIAVSKRSTMAGTLLPLAKLPRTEYKSNISIISPNAGLRLETLRSSPLTHEGMDEIDKKLKSPTTYIEMSDGTHRELHNIATISIEKTMHHLSDTASSARPSLEKDIEELYQTYDLLSQYCCLVPNDTQETSMRLNGSQQLLNKIEKGVIWYTTAKQPKKTIIDLPTLESLINTQESFTLFEERLLPKVTAANILPISIDANNEFWKGTTPQEKEKFNLVTDPLLIKLPTLTNIISTITATKSGITSMFAKFLIGIADIALSFTQYKLDIPSAKAAALILLNMPDVKENIQNTVAELQGNIPEVIQEEQLKPIIKTATAPVINWLNPDNIQAFLLLDSLIGKNINYHVNAPPEYVAINNPYRKYVMLTTQNAYTRLINNFSEGKENCTILASKHPNQTTEQYKLALEHAYIKHKAIDDASIAVAQKTEAPIKGARHYLKIKNNGTNYLVPFWWVLTKSKTEVATNQTNEILTTKELNETIVQCATADLSKIATTFNNATVFYCDPMSHVPAFMELTSSSEIYTLKPLVSTEELLSPLNLDSRLLVKTIPFFSSLYSSSIPLDRDQALSIAVKAGLYDIEEFFKNETNQNAFFAKTYPNFMQSLPPTIGEIPAWITKYTTIPFGDVTKQLLQKITDGFLKEGLKQLNKQIPSLIEQITAIDSWVMSAIGTLIQQLAPTLTAVLEGQINLIPTHIGEINHLKTLDLFSQEGIRMRIIETLLDHETLTHKTWTQLETEMPTLSSIAAWFRARDLIANFWQRNMDILKKELKFTDFIKHLPETITDEELLNPSTKESKAKILSVISNFSQFLLEQIKDNGSGELGKLFRMFIPKELADATRWKFYTVAKPNARIPTVATFEEIDIHSLDGIKQLFLSKQGPAFKAMALSEKREAIKKLDTQFATRFNAALEEWQSKEHVIYDSLEHKAIAKYRATCYAKDLERSRTSQELIVYTQEAYSMPHKKLASLIEAYTKYQRSLHTYQTLELTPTQSTTDITNLKEQIKTEAEDIIALLTALETEDDFFIEPDLLVDYKRGIIKLQQTIAKHPIKSFNTELNASIETVVSAPLKFFELFRPYATQYHLKTDAINKIATECLQQTFKESDITITAPYALSELEPITDTSAAKIKPTYHFDYKALATKAVRVSLAAKLCQYFVKDRNEFVVEALLDNAELFAGILAPNTKTTKAKTNLITKQLQKFCCYAPLKISLHGGFKHTLLYMLFYELICYIETQIPNQNIAKDLLNQLEEFVVKNTNSPITAVKEGKNPITAFEKDFLRKILRAANRITYADTKLPPIPITWLGHALLGSFNPVRASASTLETITSKDFLDTPLLAKLLKKNRIIGGATLLNTSPETLEELSKNSITKQLLPFLKGTQLVPDFYEAPWFICLKKFFIGFLTIRIMEQILTKQLATHMAKKESFFKNLFIQVTENKKKAVPNKEIKKVLEKEIAVSSKLPKSFSPIGSLAGTLGFTQAQGLLQDGLILLNARSKASLIVHLLTLGIPLFRALSIPLQKFFPKKGG